MRTLFGTDGIRARANKYPMTPDMVHKIGLVIATIFKKSTHKNRVVIAKDTRLSGYMIEQALSTGFLAAGWDVIFVGPMPTPSVSLLIKSLRADLGVMISASHNPFCDNGLKIFDADGYKLSDDIEREIEETVLNSNLDMYYVESEELGRAKRLDDAVGRYIEHVKYSFPKSLNLSGMKIVIDAANGAAYHIAPLILWELGAEVVALGTSPNGTNINNNCGAMHPEALKQKVIEEKADIGIALDGDADRIIICDEKGELVHGDHLIGIVTLRMFAENMLRRPDIVVTQLSNSALDDYLKRYGISVHRTAVGDRYVSEKMRELACNLGGEQSGHVIFGDYAKTGDGIIGALQVLALVASTRKKVSEIARPFELYPQLSKAIRYQGTNPLEYENVKNAINDITAREVDYKVIVRKSGTESLVRLMVEGKDRQNAEAILADLEKVIQLAL